MSTASRRPAWATSCGAALAALTMMTPSPDRGREGFSQLARAGTSLATVGERAAPTLPKVPFGNQPCQSLTAGDEATLKIPSPVTGKPDRAPATLPFDNMCTYINGGASYTQVGYMTNLDYDMNSGGNKSTSHQAPSSLPGAFYDQQGGLWFATNGYYVVISGRDALKETVAAMVAAKLTSA